MFYKILIAEVTCQGDGKMSYNVLRVSEVAEGDLGEGVARTRYTLLYAVLAFYTIISSPYFIIEHSIPIFSTSRLNSWSSAEFSFLDSKKPQL